MGGYPEASPLRPLANRAIDPASKLAATEWARINTDMSRLHEVVLAGSAGRFAGKRPPPPTSSRILTALDVDLPPRVATLQPD